MNSLKITFQDNKERNEKIKINKKLEEKIETKSAHLEVSTVGSSHREKKENVKVVYEKAKTEELTVENWKQDLTERNAKEYQGKDIANIIRENMMFHDIKTQIISENLKNNEEIKSLHKKNVETLSLLVTLIEGAKEVVLQEETFKNGISIENTKENKVKVAQAILNIIYHLTPTNEDFQMGIEKLNEKYKTMIERYKVSEKENKRKETIISNLEAKVSELENQPKEEKEINLLELIKHASEQEIEEIKSLLFDGEIKESKEDVTVSIEEKKEEKIEAKILQKTEIKKEKMEEKLEEKDELIQEAEQSPIKRLLSKCNINFKESEHPLFDVVVMSGEKEIPLKHIEGTIGDPDDYTNIVKASDNFYLVFNTKKEAEEANGNFAIWLAINGGKSKYGFKFLTREKIKASGLGKLDYY